ncbi:MAG: glutamate--tRNA ligase [Nitrososphaeria archaeon]
MSLGEDVEEIVRKSSLANAVKHGGKCSPEAVLGRVLGERPSLRSNVRELMRLINDVADKVNHMALKQQQEALSKYGVVEKPVRLQREENALPPLADAEKYKTVTTRFAPNPDSVLHLGSARAIILSHDYARMYNGRFILRFEDTDPRLKKAALPFYQSIREDLKWLGCMWDEEYFQSDRLPIYYEYAQKLIEVNGAYVCVCDVEGFRKKLLKKKPCPCRRLSRKENLDRFNKMLDGTYGEGSAVLRVKTDLNHPNPAVRDWPALRIVDTRRHPHPRVGSKYRVWPLYNLAAGLDDHLMGVTHIIRGKEHYTNMVRQRYMYEHLGWVYPTAIHYGRLKIEGGVLSKSKIMQGISKGIFSGFDDPRLATFQALRRRGVLPKAIRQIIYEVNVRPVDATISWATLYSINKKLVDKSSPRYFAVFDPVILKVIGLEGEKVLVLKKHPEVESMGYRRVTLHPEQDGSVSVFVKREDVERVKAFPVFRLMGFANLSSLEEREGCLQARISSYDLDSARKSDSPLIHWVAVDDHVKVKMVDQNGRYLDGVGERGLLDEPVDSMVQLEREGFARVDSKDAGAVTLYLCSR